MRNITFALCIIAAGASAHAKVIGQTVEYKADGITLEGYVAWDDMAKGNRPGILVVHDWLGVSDFTKKVAQDLAGMGYVAFAADIYGKGVHPKGPDEARVEATKYYTDRKLWRVRVNAGLDTLKKQKGVDVAKLAAIGFCFGGSSVLELARSGAAVRGFLSFHGGLASPTPDDAKNIKGKVLALAGADDPYVKPEEVAGFQKEMTDAKVDWQLVTYGGQVHAFMIPGAGTNHALGVAYDERTAKRAWQAMVDFFAEIFS